MSIPQQVQLKLNDVYDYLYKGDNEVKRYCPQCGHKTLRKGRRYVRGVGERYVFWACTYNMQPRTWRGEKHNRKPCDLVIAFDDRDAEIDDFGGVLGLMSQIHIPQIQQWLLKHDPTIHARGMEVIYEGPIFDVVRRRNDQGVGVGLYWRRQTHERENEDLFDPNNDMFWFARTEAAHHVEFRGFSASHLFANGKYCELWQQDEKEEDAVFKGKRCGKRMQAKIVDFCKAFEVAIPDILKRCKSETDRWAAERKAFEEELVSHVAPARCRISMQHYCGERRTATFSFPSVRPATAALIQDLTKIDIPFSGLISCTRSALSFDEAMKVESLLGVKYRVSLRKLDYSERFNLDMAKDLAAIIARDDS